MEGTPLRDCFICHASEDKDEVARPLANALMEAGYEVWFDEYELTVGDSLRQRIEAGLAGSRFGVVILSPHFFEKQWTQNELNGLFAKEVVGSERLILPVWHGVDEEYLVTKSPMLADRLGVPSEPFDRMVEKIIRAIEHRKGAGSTAAAIVSAQAPSAGPALAEPVELVEDGSRVRLGLTPEEKAKWAADGNPPDGPGWLAVVAGPARLQQDLLDPTEINAEDLQQIELDDQWYHDALLTRYGLRTDHQGFYARFPEEETEPPGYWLRLWEDGLMEYGRELGSYRGPLTSGVDLVIPTTSIAEIIHDYTLLFFKILQHVGYRGEAAAVVNFGNVRQHQLGVDRRRYFTRNSTIKVDNLMSRQLRGPVEELPEEVGLWTKKTMDRLFLAGGLTPGYLEISDEGQRLDPQGNIIS